MRWPWRKRVAEEPAESRINVDEERLRARRDLAEVRSRWPEVQRIVDELRFHQEANHYADLIQQVWETRR